MRIVVRDSEDGQVCAFEAIQAFYDENKGLCVEILVDDCKTELIVLPDGCEDDVLSIASRTCLDRKEQYFIWDKEDDEE